MTLSIFQSTFAASFCSTLAPAFRWRRLLACLLLSSCLGGCALVKVSSESRVFYTSSVLAGRISSDLSWNGPVVVAAIRQTSGHGEIAHYAILHEAGGFELIVPKGEYHVVAFGDANRNLTLDPGEPSGQYPAKILADGVGAVVSVDIAISGKGQTAMSTGTSVGSQPTWGYHSTQAGAIASLDEPIYSAAVGEHGYWAPVDFFRESGGNVYFLEPYDPARIPVLFVHGAAGSPQDWRFFITHLDRSRYQPWFFYYPSGASLDSMSYLLYWKLLNLERRYHFNTLYLTAHSMGGLIVRDFLAHHGAQFPAAKAFISISTPWGGDTLATLGTQYSPAVIPSWRDVQSAGPFVRSLFAKPLPNGLDYYLFFGHGGHYSLLQSSNTDGTITLESELRPEAQAEARMVYGFNENHTSILASPQVFAQFEAVLDAITKKGAGIAHGDAGNLHITFHYEQRDAVAKPDPILVLTPVNRNQARIVVPLNTLDSGKVLGPFPPGDYRANLLAFAYAAAPHALPLTIGAGGTPTLVFTLQPDGMLYGNFASASMPLSAPASDPRKLNRNVHIESIMLSDGQHTRVVIPDPGVADRTLDSWLEGKDYATQSSFSFVGLAAGDYQITIKATGQPPYSEIRHVVPGHYGELKPISIGTNAH